MNFVKVHPGLLLNIATVREVTKGPTDALVTLLTDRGSQRWAKKADWDRALQLASQTILRAAPGTFCLSYYRADEDRIEIAREPVIAWIADSAGLSPMTLTKTFNESGDTTVVEFPDGTVHSFEGLYQSAEMWAAEMRDVECRDPPRGPETTH